MVHPQNIDWRNSDAYYTHMEKAIPDCECGGPVVQRQTIKEGDNTGRYFFTCENKDCKSFMWCDMWKGANLKRKNPSFGAAKKDWRASQPPPTNAVHMQQVPQVSCIRENKPAFYEVEGGSISGS